MNASTPAQPHPLQATLPHSVAALPSGMPALSTQPAQPGRRRFSSQALLGSEREIEIDHAGQTYRLRLTSLGKLILTK